MNKNTGALHYILLFIITIVIISVLLFAKKFTPQQVVNPEVSFTPSSSPTSTIVPTTMSPSPVKKTSPMPQMTPEISSQTIQISNSDKSMAFYYTSNTQIPANTNPLGFTYTGGFIYKNGQVIPHIVYLKANDSAKAKINEVRTLDIINNSNSPQDYTYVSKWIDNSLMLSQTCYTGVSTGCKYFIVNAIYNTEEMYSETRLSSSNKYTSITRVLDWYLVQQCGDDKPCDIKVYQIYNLESLPQSFDQYTPKQTIQTNKYLVPLQLDEFDNDRNRNSTALFHVSAIAPRKITDHGTDGILMFYLKTGQIDRQNL